MKSQAEYGLAFFVEAKPSLNRVYEVEGQHFILIFVPVSFILIQYKPS